jgi:hypothetical protein
MYVYIYVCTHTYTYIHTHTQTHTHTYVYAHTHTHHTRLPRSSDYCLFSRSRYRSTTITGPSCCIWVASLSESLCCGLERRSHGLDIPVRHGHRNMAAHSTQAPISAWCYMPAMATKSRRLPRGKTPSTLPDRVAAAHTSLSTSCHAVALLIFSFFSTCLLLLPGRLREGCMFLDDGANSRLNCYWNLSAGLGVDEILAKKWA